MRYDRIPSRRLALASALAGVVFAAAIPARGQSLPNGVASGDVDQTSGVLWARGTTEGDMLFEYSTDATFNRIDGSVTTAVTDPMMPVKVEITGLRGGTQYQYRVVDASGASGTGRFRTPARSGRGGLRFGVSGDWRGELRPYPSISNVAERDLAFFVALGDTIYADFPSPDLPQPQAETLDDFRIKHNEVYGGRFGLNTWAAVRASTSLLATIDDHEVTNDFAGGAPTGSDARFDDGGTMLNETDLFHNGLRAFHEYNPIREEVYGDTGDARTAGKPKLYRSRTYGDDAAVFLLDARSFRDAPVALDDRTLDGRAVAVFQSASFDPSRTMLGEAQFADLTANLLAADAAGITWKFVMVSEPIQNLGPILTSDRFEGYAFERSRLLGFVEDNAIENVVFVAADIHGTIVNNLVYQRTLGSRQRALRSFEITTGSVAFDAPFGPTVVQFIQPLNHLFRGLDAGGQNYLVGVTANVLLASFGYPAIGLNETVLDAKLLAGSYISINTYGWTEFEIARDTQCLTVTTYGIDWYTEAELIADPDRILARRPRVVSRFRVSPTLPPSDPAAGRSCNAPPPLCGAMDGMALAVFPGFWVLRRRRGSKRRNRRV